MKYVNDPNVLVRESPALTHIDGFLITDGNNARMTLRSQMSSIEKQHVHNGLLEHVKYNRQPGVYLWDAGQCFEGDMNDVELNS